MRPSPQPVLLCFFLLYGSIRYCYFLPLLPCCDQEGSPPSLRCGWAVVSLVKEPIPTRDSRGVSVIVPSSESEVSEYMHRMRKQLTSYSSWCFHTCLFDVSDRRTSSRSKTLCLLLVFYTVVPYSWTGSRVAIGHVRILRGHATIDGVALQRCSGTGNTFESNTPEMSPIREVWAPNLELEMRNIRELIDDYPYVALVRPSANNPQPRRILTTSMLYPGH